MVQCVVASLQAHSTRIMVRMPTHVQSAAHRPTGWLVVHAQVRFTSAFKRCLNELYHMQYDAGSAK
jgi:hypothetical protein